MDKNYKVIKKGDYEVIIENVEEKIFKSGNKGFNIRFRIRTDVKQKFANRILFDNLVLTNKSLWKISNLFLAVGIKEKEEDKITAKPNEFPSLLEGKNLIVTVNPQLVHYKGKEVIQERVVAYKKSEVGEIELAEEELEEFLEKEIDFDEELIF